jgi:hypothetical protein
MRVSEQGIKNLALALSKFQEEVRNPANTASNPQFRSKYAPLDVVINTVKPILAKNGLSFIQSTGGQDESIIVTTLLIHESGEWIESDPLVLPAYQIKGGGKKEFNAQGAGSAITYGRRYSLSAILGLSSEDDDDGNGQTGAGYKDSSNNSPKNNNSNSNSGGGLSDAEREKRRQEAIAKAQARSNTTEENTDNGSSEEESPPSADSINPQQEKAIGNLLNVLSKKRGADFNKEDFLKGLVSQFGATDLSGITSDQAKEVITTINQEMRK